MSATQVKNGSDGNEGSLRERYCVHTWHLSETVSQEELAQIKKSSLGKNLTWALNLSLTNRRKVNFSRRKEKQTNPSKEQGHSNNILIMGTVTVSMF